VKVESDFFPSATDSFPQLLCLESAQREKVRPNLVLRELPPRLDFKNVIGQINRRSASERRVFLAGDPMARAQNKTMPNPTGVRCHSEVLVVVREFHWFELSFGENFLARFLTKAGFAAELMHCPTSTFGDGYDLRKLPNRIEINKHWRPVCEAPSCHAAKAGSWRTNSASLLTVDAKIASVCFQSRLRTTIGASKRFKSS